MSTHHVSKRLERVEQALERRLQDVNHRRASLVQHSRPNEWDGAGDNTPLSEPLDASRLVDERESDRLTSSRLTEDAVNLQAALERIRAGTYGLCVDCGQAIAPQRLKALPEASRCFACETRHESGPI